MRDVKLIGTIVFLAFAFFVLFSFATPTPAQPVKAKAKTKPIIIMPSDLTLECTDKRCMACWFEIDVLKCEERPWNDSN